MLAFLDESGDTGLRAVPGSSRYFVVSLVLFETATSADILNDRLHALRSELGFHPQQEFKFNKLSRELRLRFFTAVDPYNFTYYAVIVNKALVQPLDIPARWSLRMLANSLALQAAGDRLYRATVIIDGTEGRLFKRALGPMLRAAVNQRQEAINKVKIQNSTSDNLLQVADMTAGAVARSYGTTGDAHVYRQRIRRHEAGVWEWPNNERPLS